MDMKFLVEQIAPQEEEEVRHWVHLHTDCL